MRSSSGSGINAFDIVADLQREIVTRGVNQYRDPVVATLLAGHLARFAGSGQPVFVGESPASNSQAVAFTDASRTSKVFNSALGGAKVCRWNAWPFFLPKYGKPAMRELRRGAEYLRQVTDLVMAKKVFAVGRVAERCCEVARLDAEYLSHPGQDKAHLFVKRIDEILRAREV